MKLTHQASDQQLSLSLFDELPDVAQLLSKKEDQWFDRKSFKIERRKLVECLIGMANADGGRVAVGVSAGKIEGVNGDVKHLNDLMQVCRDLAEPPVRSANRFVDCINALGQNDRILVIEIEASEMVHRTTGGECFLRVGDETRSLNQAEERELAFDKGESIFDSSIVPDTTRDDLDWPRIESYAQQMQTQTSRIIHSRRLCRLRAGQECVTQAGLLLFGLQTPIWCFVRYLRYEGTIAETGTRSNLTRDERLEGTIPDLITQTQNLLKEEIRSVIRLQNDGRFASVAALPEFAWLEAVVNALTHRSYSAQGNGIHIRHFSDRLEVESPGRLPGLVRARNIRNMRFARNPHIARVLAEMTSYVRELNEGVPRMIEEMLLAGLPEPQFVVADASFRVVLFKQPLTGTPRPDSDVDAQLERLRVALGRRGAKQLMNLLRLFVAPTANGGLSTSQVIKELETTRVTATRYLHALAKENLIEYNAKSPTDPKGKWQFLPSPTWNFVRSSLSTAPANSEELA